MLHQSILQLRDAMVTGQLTARDLTEEALEAATRASQATNAFLEIEHHGAAEQAALADDAVARGQILGPLHGIPYALKDVIDVAGRRTTAQSAASDAEPAERSAPIHDALQRAGAVYVGKLATHEFALGGPSHDLPFPPVLNPWDLTRVPGASSSGAGAAVAMRAVKLAIGTDTSGSVRNPAAHCGVYGLKPTFGAVPRRGVFPLSFSLDHLGPLVASAHDLQPVLDVIAFHDAHDPTSSSSSDRAARGSAPGRLRVGFAAGFYEDDVSLASSVKDGLEQFATHLSALGHAVRRVELPPFATFNAVGRILMASESFAIHEPRITSRPEDYGRYTYQRVMPGAAVPASDHVAATQARRHLTALLDMLFGDVDVILTANALATAAHFDEYSEDWPPAARVSATRTIAFNVTGHPALAVPIGFDHDGMPVSAQLVGRHFEDSQLCALAVQIEAAGASGLPAPPPAAVTRLDEGGRPLDRSDSEPAGR